MSETSKTGEEIAAMARTYDPRLADLILGTDVLHQAAKTAPDRWLKVITRHFTDSYLPIRFRNETYAAAVIRATKPGISPKEFELELAVQMAVAEQYGEDDATLILTKKALNMRVLGAAACFRKLVDMRQSSITPPYKHNFDLAVLSPANFVRNFGMLANTQLIVAEDRSFFHTDPSNASVLDADMARDLALEAESIAYADQSSEPLILERIKQGDQIA